MTRVTEQIPAVSAAHETQYPVIAALQRHVYVRHQHRLRGYQVNDARQLARLGSMDESLSLSSPLICTSDFSRLLKCFSGAFPEVAHIDTCKNYLLNTGGDYLPLPPQLFH